MVVTIIKTVDGVRLLHKHEGRCLICREKMAPDGVKGRDRAVVRAAASQEEDKVVRAAAQVEVRDVELTRALVQVRGAVKDKARDGQ